jgi:hypothetical protein
MNESLEEEVTSINAIYALDTLTISSDSSCYILRIPNHHVSLRLQFPADYPERPPSITGPESSGGIETRKGEANEVAALARDVLGTIFQPGEPCIFSLISELEPLLEAKTSGNEASHTSGHEISEGSSSVLISTDEYNHSDSLVETLPAPEWILSSVATEKKSVFVARATKVGSVADAKDAIAHLLSTDKKAARASHNITSWRIKDASSSAVFQDCDDDGETAAGSRLLHLLQVMDAWNCCVVVTRWYGGVHLGPDRFRLINQVAREAVVAGGFDKTEDEAKKGTKHKK